MEEPDGEGVGCQRQKGKQDGIGDSFDRVEFVARMSVEEVQALEGQFALVEANGHFDLASTGIREDNLPGEWRRMSGF